MLETILIIYFVLKIIQVIVRIKFNKSMLKKVGKVEFNKSGTNLDLEIIDVDGNVIVSTRQKNEQDISNS